jgi:hypothetical protein
MVPISKVEVPVSLASSESALEAEGAFPSTSLARVVVGGKGKLCSIVIPRANKVNGLDACRSPESKRELNRPHNHRCFWRL